MSSRQHIVLATVAVLLAVGAYWFYQKRQAEAFAAASPAQKGWILISSSGCTSCHQVGSSFRAPKLDHVYGTESQGAAGERWLVDDEYIKESLRAPQAKRVAGYQGIMPAYRFTDEEISYLIEAMKSAPDEK